MSVTGPNYTLDDILDLSMEEAVQKLHDGLISQDDYDRYWDEWNASRLRSQRADWDYAESLGLSDKGPRP